MSSKPKAHDIYALLIGINCYLPNKLPDGTFYLSLKGCVEDILQVERFLLNELHLPGEHIIRLTSTSNGTTEISEPPEQWPTYRNIVFAFDRLTATAQPGDQIYIHYSGHGGRVRSLPQHRHFKSIDETLVPTDIGDSEAQYLRDIELAYLLRRMVDKGLLVTIVLDSCHAGSATRGIEQLTEVVVRGTSTIDTSLRPDRSLVASAEALAEVWQRLSPSTTRSIEVGSGWMLEPSGYVLLAACRAHEFAYEFPFDGRQKMGALTYWLLDSLRQLGSNVSYRTLYQRILSRIHSQFAQQTPQLEGAGDRVAFGGRQFCLPTAFNVMKVDAANGRILLNAGQSQGLSEGTQFAVYPLGITDLARLDKRIAIVKLTEPGPTDSWAAVRQLLRYESIEPGDQAVLLHPGTNFRPRKVRLTNRVAPQLIEGRATSLTELAEALNDGGNGFVQLASGSETADYVVSLNSQDEYVVCDSAGAAIPHQGQVLKLKDQQASPRLIERLIHLSKFRNVRELENGDPLSTLSRRMVVELTGVQADYSLQQKPNPRQFQQPGLTPTLKAGEWTFLRVRNNSAHALNITVLNLRPDWAIKQIYPSGTGLFELLETDSEFLLPLHANLSPDYDEGTDIIKVFATLGVANFRCLELPPLDDPAPLEQQARKGPRSALDKLLSALSDNNSSTRSLEAPLSAGDEWTALQVEVRILR